MKTKLNEIKAQLDPQIKQDHNALRMKIAAAARYRDHCPNAPYAVRWDGQSFTSNDTSDLVDQVITWLKRSVHDRAKDVIERMESNES